MTTHCAYEWPEPDDAGPDVDRRDEPDDQRLDGSARLERLRRLRSGRRPWRWYVEEEREPGAPPPGEITVPTELVGDLRGGLHSELAFPDEGILELVGKPDREQQPTQYRVHLERLDATCALLDRIGWTA